MNTMWTKENTAFIQASTGFVFEGSRAEGFQAYHPYRGKGWILRILREICFKVRFFPKRIWYNKEFLNKDIRYFIIWDPLITVDYLKWIKKTFPKAQINFKYSNMVGRTKHLLPGQFPEFVRVWTYDGYDSEKYGLQLYHSYMYFRAYLRPLKKPEYDVFFIGKDKGRGEWLLELEEKLKSLGLRTKFIITADGKLSKKKFYYQSEIPYSQVVDYLTRSRSVLNVTMPNQVGITLRDTESAFLGIKLLTTNKHIVDSDIYDPNDMFIIEETNFDKIPEFLNIPYRKVDQAILEKHTIDGMVTEVISRME